MNKLINLIPVYVLTYSINELFKLNLKVNSINIIKFTGDFLTVPQRREVLSSFYKKMVGTFFNSVIEGSDTGNVHLL